MNAIALQMRTLSSKVRVLTESVRDDTRKMEEADLKIHVAAWKKKEQDKAKKAIAQLPAVIKGIAKNGKSRLILRVEVSPPYLSLDISDTYKVLSSLDFRFLLESETPEPLKQLSLSNTRNFREGVRPIVRWALRQGFTVSFCKWNEREEAERFRHHDFFDIDRVATSVFENSQHGGWLVCEGFTIAW
ncbi:MAG: hypothetical protein Q8P23_03035 [bacterium]|nr:hypothetical protein [bacterium]